MSARTGALSDGSLPVGFWGKVTGHPDWCEPNYQHTYYIAELWNALSSVPLFIYGLVGLYKVIQQKDMYPQRFIACYLLVAIIGFGSFAFHGTLLYTGQMLDELPMLYGALVFLYSIWTQDDGLRVRNAVILILYALVTTALYFHLGFDFFLVAYVGSVLMLCRVSYMESKKLDERHGNSKVRQQFLLVSFGIYAAGFLFLWIPEQLLCDSTPLIKHLYMHAWFHLTSTIGPMYWVAFAATCRMQELSLPFMVVTEKDGVIPFIRITTKHTSH